MLIMKTLDCSLSLLMLELLAIEILKSYWVKSKENLGNTKNTYSTFPTGTYL